MESVRRVLDARVQRKNAALQKYYGQTTAENANDVIAAVRDFEDAAIDFEMESRSSILILLQEVEAVKREAVSLKNMFGAPVRRFFVCVWNNTEGKGVQLINVPCNESGRILRDVQYFLRIVCVLTELDLDKYELVGRHSGAAVILTNSQLAPGIYAFIPKDRDVEPLQMLGSGLPIVPRNRPTGGGSDDSSPSFSNSAEKRMCLVSSAFREELLQRDNHCVVSGKVKNLEASHIVARRHWEVLRRERLPDPISSKILGFTDGINDVQNGVLLTRDLASHFDRGEISFKYRNGHYYVIAFDFHCLQYDGLQMDENWRSIDGGETWWSITKPDPELMDFHLRNSLFAKCCGNGSNDSDDDGEDE
jgi:hypothetical protein